MSTATRQRGLMGAADSIFVSYSRRDSHFALRLAADLRARELTVWIDQHDIEPGRNWDRTIEEALAASVTIIVVLSESSVRSDNVLDEIAVALDDGKHVLPVLVEPCRVPLRLRRKQHIDFTREYSAALDELHEALANPRLATPAVEHDALDRSRSTLGTASMAVMPFRVLTQDERTELIASASHDEITNGLSRIPTFHVVSASSTRTLGVDGGSLRSVSREFGVRYAITGSLAVVADRLRVTAELCEIATAQVLWSERFDAEVGDVFEVIDRVTEAVVSRLHPHVYSAEIRRLARKSATEMSAWELVHRARMVRWSRRGINESIELLRRSLELDPDSALAHAELARALSVLAQLDGRMDLIGEMRAHVKCAMKIAPDDPAALVASCVAYNNFGVHDAAFEAGRRAIEINPNHADAWACTGFSLSGMRRPAEAIDYIRRGIELSPRDPLLYVWHLFLTHAYIMAGDREQALVENRESARLFPGNFMVHMTLAVNAAAIGAIDEAREHWAEARRMFPDVSIDFVVAFQTIQKHPPEMIAADEAAMVAAGFNRTANEPVG